MLGFKSKVDVVALDNKQNIRKAPSTGLFTASGHFDTPLISVVDGPILKLFGVVIVITGWFGLVYNNA